jgi:hypothetical protein
LGQVWLVHRVFRAMRLAQFRSDWNLNWNPGGPARVSADARIASVCRTAAGACDNRHGATGYLASALSAPATSCVSLAEP